MKEGNFWFFWALRKLLLSKISLLDYTDKKKDLSVRLYLDGWIFFGLLKLHFYFYFSFFLWEGRGEVFGMGEWFIYTVCCSSIFLIISLEKCRMPLPCKNLLIVSLGYDGHFLWGLRKEGGMVCFFSHWVIWLEESVGSLGKAGNSGRNMTHFNSWSLSQCMWLWNFCILQSLIARILQAAYMECITKRNSLTRRLVLHREVSIWMFNGCSVGNL